MSDADTEAVLGDLLMELGVEGVTLWHIRALAALKASRATAAGFSWPGSAPWHRMASDIRGEDAVLVEAWAEWSLRMQPEPEPENYDSPDQFGGSDYP